MNYKHIFIVLSLGLVACNSSSKVKVYTTTVEERTLTEVVSASGKIQPEQQVKVAPEVSGEIIELYVKEGDVVKKGQLLLVIDPEINQTYLDRSVSNVKQAQANLLQNKARVSELKARLIVIRTTYERNEKLYQDKAITVNQYEQSKTELDALKEQILAAEANVQAMQYSIEAAQSSQKEAQKNLSKTRIYAPESGVITQLNVEKGERVVGTAQMAGTELLTIADLSSMEVAVTINESDVTRINLGDTALIEVDAFRKEVFKGIVTEIANAPTLNAGASSLTVDQVANYNVKVKILESSYQKYLTKDAKAPFKTGMSATVDVITQTVPHLKTIPINSVTTQFNDSLNKMEELVYILDGTKAKAQVITTGIQDDQYIEVKTGLALKTPVIEGPYKAIKELLKDAPELEKVSKEQFLKEQAQQP